MNLIFQTSVINTIFIKLKKNKQNFTEQNIHNIDVEYLNNIVKNLHADYNYLTTLNKNLFDHIIFVTKKKTEENSAIYNIMKEIQLFHEYKRLIKANINPFKYMKQIGVILNNLRAIAYTRQNNRLSKIKKSHGTDMSTKLFYEVLMFILLKEFPDNKQIPNHDWPNHFMYSNFLATIQKLYEYDTNYNDNLYFLILLLINIINLYEIDNEQINIVNDVIARSIMHTSPKKSDKQLFDKINKITNDFITQYNILMFTYPIISFNVLSVLTEYKFIINNNFINAINGIINKSIDGNINIEQIIYIMMYYFYRTPYYFFHLNESTIKIILHNIQQAGLKLRLVEIDYDVLTELLSVEEKEKSNFLEKYDEKYIWDKKDTDTDMSTNIPSPKIIESDQIVIHMYNSEKYALKLNDDEDDIGEIFLDQYQLGEMKFIEDFTMDDNEINLEYGDYETGDDEVFFSKSKTYIYSGETELYKKLGNYEEAINRLKVFNIDIDDRDPDETIKKRKEILSNIDKLCSEVIKNVHELKLDKNEIDVLFIKNIINMLMQIFLFKKSDSITITDIVINTLDLLNSKSKGLEENKDYLDKVMEMLKKKIKDSFEYNKKIRDISNKILEPGHIIKYNNNRKVIIINEKILDEFKYDVFKMIFGFKIMSNPILRTFDKFIYMTNSIFTLDPFMDELGYTKYTEFKIFDEVFKDTKSIFKLFTINTDDILMFHLLMGFNFFRYNNYITHLKSFICNIKKFNALINKLILNDTFYNSIISPRIEFLDHIILSIHLSFTNLVSSNILQELNRENIKEKIEKIVPIIHKRDIFISD